MDKGIQPSTFSVPKGLTIPFHHRSKDASLTLTTVEEDEVRKMQFRDRIELLKVIKACRKEKELWKVRRIHNHLINENLVSKDVHIATALIITYTKYGLMEKAQEIFQQLAMRDVVAWNAMITGYAKNGCGHESLKCFAQMKDEGVFPNRITYIFVFKACGIVGSLEMGAYVDADVRKSGLLQEDIVLGNALVDMYCKCGALKKAREVFEQLPVRDVVSWSALIAGYIVNGLGHEALQCFIQMQDSGVLPDMVTYVSVLKGCGMVGCLEIGARIEADVRKRGGLFQEDVVLGTAMVDMYAKCGAMEKARKVFEQLPARDAVSWNAMISGYTRNGLCDEALKCFKQMKDMGVCPNVVTYICCLKACGIVGSLEIGKGIDLDVRKRGLLQKNVILRNTLVDMYAKCGALEKARETIEQLQLHNVVAWSALIAGYVQNGLTGEALKCFKQMQDTGVSPDNVTFISLLKACGTTGSLEIGKDIDNTIRKQGLAQKDIMLGTALVDMYSRHGAMEKAQEVFEHLQVQDLVAWSALIAGYTRNGLGNEALKCFMNMQEVGVRPDVVTYVSILKACGIVGSLKVGEDIHAIVRKQGLLEKDAIIVSALVDMYFKCGAVEKAQEVFEKLHVPDVASWNTLITGYTKTGLGHEALRCFKKMLDLGFSPNIVTYIGVLKACAMVGSLEIGQHVEDDIRKRGLLQRHVSLGNTLLGMYSSCCLMDKAREVFDQLSMPNVMSWNTMIAGYVQTGLGDEALQCVREMQDVGVSPDAATYVSALKACGIVGSLDIGEDIDAKVRKLGLLKEDVVMSNALLDMYSKCGSLEKSRKLFETLLIRSVVSWSSLIAGYAKLGQANAALELYRRMKTEGIAPDLVLYTILLTACCHVGLVKEGEKLFDEMCNVYCLKPTLEHYTCMIDLYGRAGDFNKAKAILDKMQHCRHLPMFLSLLGSCREWRNVQLGMWVFKQSVQLGEECGAAFVCVGNILTASEMQIE